MKLFDTHCHFETTDAQVIRATLERAKAAGVAALMAVGCNDQTNSGALAAFAVADGDVTLPKVCMALGFDREVADGTAGSPPTEDDLLRMSVPRQGLAAVGEIGLDYHYSPATRQAQLKLFAAELQLAHERDLPVVIHTREADDDTVALLREIPSKGIIHCYTGTVEYAKRYLELGFYISISGIVTFRAADNVRAAALAVPDDRLLIETDSPYLAPVPMRGRTNEPAFIAHTCQFLANLRKTDPDTLSELTCANALSVLGG